MKIQKSIMLLLFSSFVISPINSSADERISLSAWTYFNECIKDESSIQCTIPDEPIKLDLDINLVAPQNPEGLPSGSFTVESSIHGIKFFWRGTILKRFSENQTTYSVRLLGVFHSHAKIDQDLQTVEMEVDNLISGFKNLTSIGPQFQLFKDKYYSPFVVILPQSSRFHIMKSNL